MNAITVQSQVPRWGVQNHTIWAKYCMFGIQIGLSERFNLSQSWWWVGREWWLLDYNLMSCLSNLDNLFIYFRHTPPPAMARLQPFSYFHSAHSFAAKQWNLLQTERSWNNPIAGYQLSGNWQFGFLMTCKLDTWSWKIKQVRRCQYKQTVQYLSYSCYLSKIRFVHTKVFCVSHWGEFKCIHSKTLPVVF